MVRGTLAVLGSILTVIGFQQYVQQRLSKPPPMSGDLNIVVAPFHDQLDDEDRSRDLEALAYSVHTTLKSELGQLFSSASTTLYRLDVQVRDPREVDPVDDSNLRARVRSVTQIAAQNHADIVVFASADVSATATRLFPRVYISPSKLVGAEEVAGTFNFGPPIDIPTGFGRTTVASARARAELAHRVEVLAAFAEGLGYFTDALLGHHSSYNGADYFFQRAGDLTVDQSGELAAFIHLYRANVAAERGAYPQAIREYHKALVAQPTFGRARYGLAQAEWLQHAGECDRRTLDRTAVTTAVATLQSVANARQYLARVRARAHTTVGRALLCLHDAGYGDRLDHARAEAEAALAFSKGADPSSRENISDAQAVIGDVWLRTSQAEPDLRRAAAAFRAAATMTQEPNRRAELDMSIHYVYVLLGEPAQARRFLTAAITADPSHASRYRADAEEQQRYVTGGR